MIFRELPWLVLPQCALRSAYFLGVAGAHPATADAGCLPRAIGRANVLPGSVGPS